MNNQECNETSISRILNFILNLQQAVNHDDLNKTSGCNKSYLGQNTNNGITINTRPITLYSCCTGALWTMPYTLNDTSGESNVFKISKVDDNCATFEILAPNPDTTNPLIPYISTNNFFTIKLDCVLAIRCLADTYTN